MKFRLSVIIFFLLCGGLELHAAQSVTLTLLDPPTTLSNGKPYYAAGRQYRFRVQAVNTSATSQADWNSININFISGGSTIRFCQINIAGGIAVGPPAPVGVDVNIGLGDVTNNTIVWTNLDITVRMTFLWSGAALDFNSPPANSVQVIVDDLGAGVNNGSDTLTFNYGICSRIQIMNFAGTADAADRMVNPWHAAFNVTGRIVYYMAGEPLITNRVNDVVGSDETNSVLPNANAPQLITRIAPPLTITDSDATQDLSFTVAASYLSTNFGGAAAVGNYSWTVQVTMVNRGTPATITSVNSFTFNCNRIQINAVTFEEGGGRDAGALPGLTYSIRSINQPGTRVRVTAQLQVAAPLTGTTNMIGETFVRIVDGFGNASVISIAGGSTTATVLAFTPTLAQVPVGATTLSQYTVTAIWGGAYDGDGAASGQVEPPAGRIVQPAPPASQLYWENQDPPGQNIPTFTSLIGVSSTATSITLNWTSLAFGPPAPFDGDFDSYRIYYKATTSLTWLMLDRTTAGYAALGTIGTNSVSINGLLPLTNYDYRISAIDLFGNEVVLANRIDSGATPAQTAASTVDVTITDGISTYNNTAFNDPNPASHTVRLTAIKVSLYVVTSGGIPDQVNILVASNDSDIAGAPQYGVTGTANSIPDNVINGTNLADGVSRWRITCPRLAPNSYEGFIPSDHPLMKQNTNIRFIVEIIKGASTSYSDHTPDLAPPGDCYSDEWRFQVSQPAVFIPWPTRVLNNVMTKMMPCCYPAYFLVADAIVTIKVYDIKGRVIATLADNMPRPGGQNIKEGGWCGRNRDNNRAGPGLYYIHIFAKSYGGKIVLDKTMKVVISH